MFSERLKQARKNKKFSQAELSRLLGVTQQAVGKWETGRSTPDPGTVARLAEILDTTADALLGLQQPECTAPVGDHFVSYGESPIPVVGTVRAGYGALAFEEDYGTEYACVKDPSSYFYLVAPVYPGKRGTGRHGLRHRRGRHSEKIHSPRKCGRAASL